MLLAFVWMSSRHLNENNMQIVCCESLFMHFIHDVRAAGACPTGLSMGAYKKNNPKELKTGPQGIYFHLPNKGIDNINGPGSVWKSFRTAIGAVLTFQQSYICFKYVHVILCLAILNIWFSGIYWTVICKVCWWKYVFNLTVLHRNVRIAIVNCDSLGNIS